MVEEIYPRITSKYGSVAQRLIKMHVRGRFDVERWALSTAGFGVKLPTIDRFIAQRWFTVLEIAKEQHPHRRIHTESMKQ